MKFDSDLNDDGKLRQKYQNKKINAKKEGIECLLSYQEYCNLVREAGLVSSQLGFSGQKYVLARYNDLGNYEIGNCRFITQKENYDEKHKSKKELNAWKQGLISLIEYNSKQTTEQLSQRIKNSKKWQEYNLQRQKIAEQRLKEKDLQKHPSYKGEHNSQYGTYWITDGSVNKKWKDSKGCLPQGFYRGRTI